MRLVTVGRNPDGSSRISVVDARGERVVEPTAELAWLANALRSRVDGLEPGPSLEGRLDEATRVLATAQRGLAEPLRLLQAVLDELVAQRKAIEGLTREVARQNLDRASVKAWIAEAHRREGWLQEAKGGQ
jgi:hypothetical protein